MYNRSGVTRKCLDWIEVGGFPRRAVAEKHTDRSGRPEAAGEAAGRIALALAVYFSAAGVAERRLTM
jgi:hypothetical protein